MNSQRLKQHTQGLQSSIPGPLCIYYDFQFSVQTSVGLLFLVPSLGFSFFCLFHAFLMFHALFFFIIFIFKNKMDNYVKANSQEDFFNLK